MKRSCCASGSGYVPSCSIGFCVASTKNGSESLCRTRPTVTCRSCMASSSAACVLGGVRFISSARITLENSGPSRKRNSRLPVERFSSMISVPVMSGRHQVGRELDAAERQVQGPRQRADHQRLGQPGHALQQAMAAAEQRDQQFFDDLVLADDHAAELLDDFFAGVAQAADGGRVVNVKRVVGHWADGSSRCRLPTGFGVCWGRPGFGCGWPCAPCAHGGRRRRRPQGQRW